MNTSVALISFVTIDLLLIGLFNHVGSLSRRRAMRGLGVVASVLAAVFVGGLVLSSYQGSVVFQRLMLWMLLPAVFAAGAQLLGRRASTGLFVYLIATLSYHLAWMAVD